MKTLVRFDPNAGKEEITPSVQLVTRLYTYRAANFATSEV
jgi:hypothetical protein